MNLKSKKELVARTLGVGVSRVKLMPEAAERISDAITRDEIRSLVDQKAIVILQKKGVSRSRVKKGKRSGPGSRKGSKGARQGKKDLWVKKVRALRIHLKYLLEHGVISKENYKKLYLWIKGGQIRTVKRLDEIAREMGRRGE
ncbi:MAG: 50S ribosomal protein L19e [Nitrososphaeria archaeon]|nr:50S ribosomal protein L19e [Nitrososphaeria archaeon]